MDSVLRSKKSFKNRLGRQTILGGGGGAKESTLTNGGYDDVFRS